MIDIYAVAGTFADVHKLATDATGVRAVNDLWQRMWPR
jgi:hypothetical protein